jgi:phosphoribosylanthranilate isomerase
VLPGDSLVHIKICGLASLDDTLAAIDAGADYLGFNFYPPSSRYIAPQACARILGQLAQRGTRVTTVGLFVNRAPAEVAAVLDDCGLDLAQLHGDERSGELGLLQGRAFKAVRDSTALTADDLAALSLLSSGRRQRDREPEDAAAPRLYGDGRHPAQPAFLLDAQVPNSYGGTGRLADWDKAAVLAADYPIFLAGGLTAANVAAAIAQVRPWGVDVASGVESAPGVKDHAKIRAFVQAASQAAATLPTRPGASGAKG